MGAAPSIQSSMWIRGVSPESLRPPPQSCAHSSSRWPGPPAESGAGQDAKALGATDIPASFIFLLTL